jgi:hypothetical protein
MAKRKLTFRRKLSDDVAEQRAEKKARPPAPVARRAPKPSKATVERVLSTNRSLSKWAWKPGQSGNPSGMPKNYGEFVKTCRGYTNEALSNIVAMMRLPVEPATLKYIAYASALMLERGWGKTPQFVVDPTDKGNQGEDGSAPPVSREYWDKVLETLQESGALAKKTITLDAAELDGTSDAEIVGEEEKSNGA